jgi:FixJ family two-component response regulator
MQLISIVDDDRTFGQAIQTLLKSLGYAAACFTSAAEYLRSPIRSDTVCLILDVHMPEMSGLELQARLLTEGDRKAIIFISGEADDRTKERALQGGARGFLSKPVDHGALVRLLAECGVNPASDAPLKVTACTRAGV